MNSLLFSTRFASRKNAFGFFGEGCSKEYSNPSCACVCVQAFSDIKNYYNDITHNNLDLIKTLKEDVTEMKKKDSQNEKLMFEIAQENKRLSEPLQKVQPLPPGPPRPNPKPLPTPRPPLGSHCSPPFLPTLLYMSFMLASYMHTDNES